MFVLWNPDFGHGMIPNNACMIYKTETDVLVWSDVILTPITPFSLLNGCHNGHSKKLSSTEVSV